MDDSPESIMMESVLEGKAEYYSKNLGREVMKGMNETALQCKHTGGCPPLGYDLDADKKLVINPHEAEAVKIIFRMFADGHGYTEIINYLNEKGYKTKRGRIFGKNSLYEILANEKYTGVFVFNKAAAKTDGKRNNHAYKSNSNVIRIENGCPAIVSKKLFEKVQRIKSKNRRNTGQYHAKEFYLLTGKVFCGVCGKRIQGNLRFSGERKNRLATYRCDEPRKICNNKENNKDYLDSYVVELLREKIFNKAALKRRIKAVNAYIQKYNARFDEHYQNAENELNNVLAGLANITEAVEKGIITSAIMERAEALEEKRSELQNQLNSLRRFTPLEFADYVYLIDEFKNIPRNTAEFRTFVQTYIDKIVTYPYHIEITLDVGFGITEELKETIMIRRGELYAMFESHVKEY